MGQQFTMKEDTRQPAPVVQIWAPSETTDPDGFKNMQTLKAHIHEIKPILQENGVTKADFMPPRQRGTYTPDDALQYEVFTEPKTLRLGKEGESIDTAIQNITGLFGTMCPPLMNPGHMANHNLTSIYRINETQQGGFKSQ